MKTIRPKMTLLGRKPTTQVVRCGHRPVAVARVPSQLSLFRWTKSFFRDVQNRIQMPFFGLFPTDKPPVSEARGPRLSPAQVEQANIRAVMREIRWIRRTTLKAETVQTGLRALFSIVPETAYRRPQTFRRRSIKSALGRERESFSQEWASVGGRRLVTKKRLLDMGITPMLLNSSQSRNGSQVEFDRDEYAKMIREAVLLDLRALLEESR